MENLGSPILRILKGFIVPDPEKERLEAIQRERQEAESILNEARLHLGGKDGKNITPEQISNLLRAQYAVRIVELPEGSNIEGDPQIQQLEKAKDFEKTPEGQKAATDYLKEEKGNLSSVLQEEKAKLTEGINSSVSATPFLSSQIARQRPDLIVISDQIKDMERLVIAYDAAQVVIAKFNHG